MTYIEISRIAVILASATITFGFYAQAWKLWKFRSSKDFSLALVFAVLINELIWINYGIALNEWPIILVGCLNMPAVLTITIGYFKFR